MSFKGYKRSIKLEFDYEEVKEGIPRAKQQMAILNAEFKKSSEEAKASGNETENLGVKYDYLTNRIKIQEKEVEAYREKLEQAKNAQGNNTKAVENASTSLEIAEAKLGQTKAQLDMVTKELEKQKTTLGKTSDEWLELSEKTAAIGKSMSIKFTAPILAAAGASFKLGADYQDALGKADTVFKENAAEIKKWSDTSLKEFGLARSTALAMATDFASGFNQLGIGMNKSTEWSKNLTERTNDLATFYNATVAETQNALTAILSGQTEPLKKFNIFMTQANLQNYAYSQGLRKKISEMTEAEKVELRYRYVMSQTAQAQGNFKKEQDGATAQMTLFKEGLKELGERFSEHILPIFTPVIKGMNTMIEKFAGLNDGTKKFIVIAGGLVAVVGPVMMALSGVFKVIHNISTGIGAIPKVIDGVGKAGKAFKGLLDNTAFMGFVKWAAIIAGVVIILTGLIMLLNVLLGKGNETSKVIGNMADMMDSVGNVTSGAATRGYAVGTRYHPGGVAMVGEEGPELVDLPRGASVHTAQDTKKMLSGGGDTYILQVNMDEVDEVSKLVRVFNDFKQVKKAGVLYGEAYA